MTKLEFLRRNKGSTQLALARRGGFPAKSIANLERGHWAGQRVQGASETGGRCCID